MGSRKEPAGISRDFRKRRLPRSLTRSRGGGNEISRDFHKHGARGSFGVRTGTNVEISRELNRGGWGSQRGSWEKISRDFVKEERRIKEKRCGSLARFLPGNESGDIAMFEGTVAGGAWREDTPPYPPQRAGGSLARSGSARGGSARGEMGNGVRETAMLGAQSPVDPPYRS